MEFKRLFVYNFHEKVTTDEISSLFGFNATDYLVKWCCIELKDGENNTKSAKVICPADVHGQTLKLNGIEYLGRKLEIVDADPPPVTTPAQESNNQTHLSNNTNEDEGEILFIRLDFRRYPSMNFPAVEEGEVCDALMLDHSDDPYKAIKRGWGRNLGTYVIESKDMNRYVNKSVVIRGKEIQLEAIRKKKRQTRENERDPDGLKNI